MSGKDTGELLNADPAHPVLIPPERYHHVQLTGPVQFRVEFYNHAGVDRSRTDPDATRPGEAYLKEPSGVR